METWTWRKTEGKRKEKGKKRLNTEVTEVPQRERRVGRGGGKGRKEKEREGKGRKEKKREERRRKERLRT